MNANYIPQPTTCRQKGKTPRLMIAALAIIAASTLRAPHALAATYKDLSGNGYISLEDAQKSCDIRPEHFRDLGLNIDPNVPEGVTSPYPEDKATDLVSQREVYVEANGANDNKYSVRDYLDVLGPKNGSHTKAHDSNGDLKGAYSWWKLSKKQPNADYGGTVGSHLSDNATSVLTLEKANYFGKYATSVAYSATKGAEARDNHVAELRAHAEAEKLGTPLGNVTYVGGISIELFSIDEHGKRVSAGSLAPTVNDSQVLEVNGSHEFKYLDSGYLLHACRNQYAHGGFLRGGR